MKKIFFIITIVFSLLSIPTPMVMAEETSLNPRSISHQIRKVPSEITFPNITTPTSSQITPYTSYDLAQAKANLNRLMLRDKILSQ